MFTMKLSLKIIIIVKKKTILKPHKEFLHRNNCFLWEVGIQTQPQGNIKEYPLPGFSSADSLLVKTNLDSIIHAQPVLCSKPSDWSGLSRELQFHCCVPASYRGKSLEKLIRLYESLWTCRAKGLGVEEEFTTCL